MTERLRVAFEATPVLSGRTGIARYVTELASALIEEGVEVEKVAVGRSRFPIPADVRHLPIPARLAQRWWRVSKWPPIEGFVGAADLVHATGLLIPATTLPLVITVHDLAALRYPKLHPARNVRQQEILLGSLDKAAAVIAVSKATAAELAERGVPADRLVVTPLGLSPAAAARDAARHSSPRRNGFLLTVGESAPRKNYGTLVRALARTDPELTLTMAGPPAGDENRIGELIDELGLGSRVNRLGAVSEAQLAALYDGAIALCFPSRAEGFGLPVLEAMAAGVPVVASDLPVLREVAGEAALFVNPADERAWAEALRRVASDAELRNRLTAEGRERAKAFTWQRTAAATVMAYKLALAHSGRPR